MNFRYYISIFCLFFSSVIANNTKAIAQANNAVISGNVADQASKQPIEFATVQLLNAADSAVIITTVTDHKGKFLLENVSMGHFVLRFSFIGYTKMIMPISVNKPKENISTVEMALMAKDIGEVTVTTRKSLLNTSIDRKIYNVTQDIMAQSGSASDVLKNVPSVEVDIDGNVSLRGSQDVLILINGRPSPLMGKSKAEVLQQLTANSIERIEVITNPSARYKPEGTSGIINIVMKKNNKIGTNGSLIFNTGNQDRYNGTISLNYKPGKVNYYSNYNIRQDYRIRLNNITREYLDSMGKTKSFYTEDNQSPARPLSKIITLGADYTLNKENSIGISANYNKRDLVKKDVLKKLFYNKNNLLTGSNNRLRYDPEFEKEKDATAYWQHNFLKEDHELRVQLNVSAQDEVEDNYYTTIYNFPVLPSLFSV